MAIVLFGGTYAVQPVQGEMRRFITRTRVDGTVTRVKDSGSDTNKVLKINKNWFVECVWVNVVQISTDVHFGGIIIYDSNGDTFGPYIPLGTADAATAGATGAYGGLPKLYTAAADLRASLAASFSTTYFNGIFDVYASVVDLNAYESPHSPSWAD